MHSDKNPQIISFNFTFQDDTEIQTVLFNNEPYFVAADVCSALELTNVTKALYCLDSDEKLPLPVVRAGQQRTVNMVNESGLYALIFQSRKPNAKKFRKWVTSEVLPKIRETGFYNLNQSNTDTDIYRLLEIETMRTKIYKDFFDSTSTYLDKLIRIGLKYRKDYIRTKKQAGEWKSLYYQKDEFANTATSFLFAIHNVHKEENKLLAP